MELVGIKELKNKLTYYLRLTRQGNKIVVTDRGSPVAIIHRVDEIEEKEDPEERLASLAKRGQVRLPVKRGKFKRIKTIQVSGKPASEIIMEERR